MRQLAPIALFVYNRPGHTKQTLDALAKNPEAEYSTLHVFCDGPKPGASETDLEAIREVRRIVRGRQWCSQVVIEEAEANLGLAKSIKTGIDRVLEHSDRIIVLEDDIETSLGFLAFMNHALDIYADDERVMHVSAYLPATSYQSLLPPSFLHQLMLCWGWATWQRAWKHFRTDGPQLLEDIRKSPNGMEGFNLRGAFRLTDQLTANLEGRISTWAVFWAASIYLNSGLCLLPGKSLAQNIGCDGSGEHCNDTREFAVSLVNEVSVRRQRIRESRIGDFYLRSFFRYGLNSSIYRRLRIGMGLWKHKVAVRIKRTHASGPP